MGYVDHEKAREYDRNRPKRNHHALRDRHPKPTTKQRVEAHLADLRRVYAGGLPSLIMKDER